MTQPTPPADKYTTFFCPRCDRKFISVKNGSMVELLERVKKHVAGQHPDHDPEWYDTHSSDHPEDETKVRT